MAYWDQETPFLVVLLKLRLGCDAKKKPAWEVVVYTLQWRLSTPLAASGLLTLWSQLLRSHLINSFGWSLNGNHREAICWSLNRKWKPSRNKMGKSKPGIVLGTMEVTMIISKLNIDLFLLGLSTLTRPRGIKTKQKHLLVV